jgi:hypothetical protein
MNSVIPGVQKPMSTDLNQHRYRHNGGKAASQPTRSYNNYYISKLIDAKNGIDVGHVWKKRFSKDGMIVVYPTRIILTYRGRYLLGYEENQ